MQTEGWRVGTVDTFQGQEGTLVIASTIRTDSGSPMDFVANKNRLNVMFSRAKAKLVILNHKDAFKDEPLFQKLYDFIEKNPSETAILNYNETLENEVNEVVEG